MKQINDRQLEILKYLQKNPMINSSEIQKVFYVSRETVNRIIRVLLEKNLVRRSGRGKATYYELL